MRTRVGGAGHAALAAAEEPLVQLCAFEVGGEEYAIDLRRLREILQPLPITPVPHAPEFIEGVMNVRGEVIPVVDARRRLGKAVQGGGRCKVLVVKVAGRVFGLIVDAVREVVRLPRAEFGPPPPLLVEGGPRLFLGVCGARGGQGGRGPRKLRLLLNVKAILTASAAELSAATRAAARPENA